MIASVHTAFKAASLVLAASLPLAPLTGPPLAAGHYATIKVPGGTDVMAEGISDSGTIVGCDHRKAGDRGFIKKGRKFTVLADPAAGAKGSTCAFSVNTHGMVVGEYESRQFHGFVFKNGKFTTIDDPKAGQGLAQSTIAIDINDFGTIVGYYFTATQTLGFILRNGKFTSVSFPGHLRAKGRRTVLTGISDNGMISGDFLDQAGDHVGFIYHDGRFRRISVPHAKTTGLACISEHGKVIVGYYRVTKTAPQRAFVLRDGVYRTLRASSGRGPTQAQCGNDLGEVVGYVQSNDNGASPFLFTPGK